MITHDQSGDAATLENLGLQLMELRLTLEGLERERDFYFEKLTRIEEVVAEPGVGPGLATIKNILYRDEVRPAGGTMIAYY